MKNFIFSSSSVLCTVKERKEIFMARATLCSLIHSSLFHSWSGMLRFGQREREKMSILCRTRPNKKKAHGKAREIIIERRFSHIEQF